MTNHLVVEPRIETNQVMNQEWFEMANIRKRLLANSVWIPLRAVHTIELRGKYGYVGHREEFYGVGTIAVPIKAKVKAEQLGWTEVGISREHFPDAESDHYFPCDVFKLPGGETGVPLVLEQHGNSEENSQWHLHQDFVIAFGLKRENDVWVCFDENYVEVVRFVRRQDGKPGLLEVKAEFLRDYLCARNMALYVTSYRSRLEIVEKKDHIRWADKGKTERSGGDRWEGRILPIHEGGMPFGGGTTVIHAGRTDVDPEEDIPSFGFPTDENVTSRTWTIEEKGRKLFVINGELWRNEWVDPSTHSTRVRGDKLPATVYFITNASGKKETRDTLTVGSRWLWFKPEVIVALSDRRGGSLSWYTRDTGDVRCSPSYRIHFGINKLGLINVYAKDIALLPDWQQQIWSGFNISPEGGVSEELLASQMKATPATTKAPEAFLSRAFLNLDEVCEGAFGSILFREHEKQEEILRKVHRFRAIDQSGLFDLAKDLARLTADRIETKVLHKIVNPPKGEKWGSLKSLEMVLATLIPPNDARSLMSPLVGIYELRHSDAHLPGKEIREAMQMVGIDPTAMPIHQGYQLLHACVSKLYEIADVISTFCESKSR